MNLRNKKLCYLSKIGTLRESRKGRMITVANFQTVNTLKITVMIYKEYMENISFLLLILRFWKRLRRKALQIVTFLYSGFSI